MGCMGDLSTVSGHIPELRRNGMDVILLNIHESPGRDLLSRFKFEFTPTYVMFDGSGEEIYRSNSLPTVREIINITTTES